MSLLQTRNNIRVRDGLKKKTTTFFPQMRYFEMPRDASGFYVNAMASDLCCVEMVYAFTMESAVQWDLIQKLIELQDEASQHHFESNIYV